MSDSPFIIGLGGSMNEPSTTLAALEAALAGAERAGATTRLFSVRELDLPMYVHGASPPPNVEELCDEVERCQGMIWSSPLYHGSVSGAFKNALDWLQVLSDRGVPFLNDKVIGLVATAAGVQALNAINTMEFMVRALRGYAVPLVIPIARSQDAFDAEGDAIDAKVADQLAQLGSEVVRAARLMSAGTPLDG